MKTFLLILFIGWRFIAPATAIAALAGLALAAMLGAALLWGMAIGAALGFAAAVGISWLAVPVFPK